MNLTLEIPDDPVSQLSAAGGDLSRRALEHSGTRRFPGFSARYELDGFLKTHEVCGQITPSKTFAAKW